MRIHITLVGGQTAPVYSGIIHSKAEKVYLVCSRQSRGEAERIVASVSPPSILVELNPTDMAAVFYEVTRMREHLGEEDEISLNLVGGTKTWSLFFYYVFKDRPFTTFELVDQNNRIWNFDSKECEDLPPIDIDTIFRLYGNPLVKSYRYSDYSREDMKAAEKVRRIRLKWYPHFNTLTTTLNKDWAHSLGKDKSGRFSVNDKNYVTWDKEAGEVELSLSKKNGDAVVYKISSPRAIQIVFNCGWFESSIAEAFSMWKRALDIRLNCLFPVSEAQDANIKNEVDVVVSTGKRLLFVECKTQLFKGVDVDKFASVVKHYGGMGAKGILVTDMPLTSQTTQKCVDYGLLHFSLKDHVSPSDPFLWRTELIKYVDSEIESNNK